MSVEPFLPQEVIRKKRDKQPISDAEIRRFVEGITNGSVTHEQISAFAMAVYFNDMSREECAALTLAMRDSGRVMSHETYGLRNDQPIVDKHSTGGVGDKVSLMLAPIVAACGGYVPMIAGRGLGHSGGTVDKFQAIPGYDVFLSNDRFAEITRSLGCSIIGQTEDLAPADKIFYSVRDVTSTVESIPLITASILSKKLAAGLDALVMDVKFGSGAFMDTQEKAEALAASIVSVAEAAGLSLSALITDMNQVLGTTAGNAVEVQESVDFLNNPQHADSRLRDVTLDLAAEMLSLAGLAGDFDQGREKALEALHSGAAAKRFGMMIAAQGGPEDFMDNAAQYLKIAEHHIRVTLPEGFVSAIDTRAIGNAVIVLGGGRTDPAQTIDHSVGLIDIVGLGAHVGDGRPFCTVVAADLDKAEAAIKMIKHAVTVSDKKPEGSAGVTARIIRSEGSPR